MQGGVATFGDAGHEAEAVHDKVSAAQTQEGSAGGENSQEPLGQCKCFFFFNVNYFTGIIIS